jgi:hypothetical protein
MARWFFNGGKQLVLASGESDDALQHGGVTRSVRCLGIEERGGRGGSSPKMWSLHRWWLRLWHRGWQISASVQTISQPGG